MLVAPALRAPLFGKAGAGQGTSGQLSRSGQALKASFSSGNLPVTEAPRRQAPAAALCVASQLEAGWRCAPTRHTWSLACPSTMTERQYSSGCCWPLKSYAAAHAQGTLAPDCPGTRQGLLLVDSRVPSAGSARARAAGAAHWPEELCASARLLATRPEQLLVRPAQLQALCANLRTSTSAAILCCTLCPEAACDVRPSGNGA